MSTEPTDEPILAAEAGNGTTTLAVASDEPAMTVPLSQRLASVQYWTTRRDLHDVNSKTYKILNKKVEVLDGMYQRELAAWKGRKMMEPALRLESKKRRAETMAAKKQATVARLVDAVEGIVTVNDKAKLAAAVADALEPPAEAPKKKAKKAKKVHVEEGDSE